MDWLKQKLSSATAAVKETFDMESSPLVNDQQGTKALNLPAPPPNTTMTGGKRYRKTRRHRPKKHRKTGKRKH